MGAIYKTITNEHDPLERLFTLSFKECAKKISQMDTIEKAEIAAQVQPKLDALYLQADKYGNPDYPREEQIGPEIFMHIMSQIKRWETIIYWLYEIDILMGETELDRLIQEAEHRLDNELAQQQIAAGKEVTRFKFIADSDGVKHRTKINVQEELKELQTQKINRGIHTDEIMSQAAALTKKYFK